MLPCLFLNCPCRVQTNDVHIPAPFWARKESGPVSRKLSYGLQFFVFSFGSKHHYDFDWSTRMFCRRTTLASFCIAKPPTVQLCSINTTNRWPALYQTHHRPPVRTSVQLLTSTSCTVCQSYPRWRARGTRSGYPHHNQSSQDTCIGCLDDFCFTWKSGPAVIYVEFDPHITDSNPRHQNPHALNCLHAHHHYRQENHCGVASSTAMIVITNLFAITITMIAMVVIVKIIFVVMALLVRRLLPLRRQAHKSAFQ